MPSDPALSELESALPTPPVPETPEPEPPGLTILHFDSWPPFPLSVGTHIHTPFGGRCSVSHVPSGFLVRTRSQPPRNPHEDRSKRMDEWQVGDS